MAAIFEFDDMDEPEYHRLVNGFQGISLAKTTSKSSNYDQIQSSGDCETAELDDTVGELFPQTGAARPITIKDTSNKRRGSFGSSFQPGSAGSASSRLGKSFEVGIDQQFVSSFVDEDNCKTEEIPRHKMVPSDFEHLKVLGQGTYGKVLLVRERATGRLYAQKQLKKASMIVEEKKIQQTKTEKEILESVRHPYIVKLFYALQDHDKLYLILEYAQGGELFHHLSNQAMLSEDVVSFYGAEMALALHHLHVNVGVVYRDLKPENCLLDADGHLVLTDFGLSKVATEEAGECNTFLGTPEFMAPEILKGESYDYGVDWWSLGAVCYNLLTGSPPFPGNNHTMILNKIKRSKRPDFPFFLSTDAQDLIARLLRKEPKKRLGYKDFEKTIKKHRFFRKIDWKKLESRDPSVIPPIQPLITDPELAENFSSEFTDLIISPADYESSTQPTAIPLSGKGGGDSQPFKGFSFTASQSFIDCAY